MGVKVSYTNSKPLFKWPITGYHPKDAKKLLSTMKSLISVISTEQ